MKRLPLLITFSMALSLTQVQAQTTYIANNNPGAATGTNVFTGTNALQNAIDAAISGDIIHVIPGPNNYGDVTVDDKSLTIVGVGLNTQGAKSLADDIELNNTGSSGTRISGLHFDRLLLANDNTSVHTVSNVLLENSVLDVVIGPGFTTNSVANLIVRNCVLNSANSTFDAQAFELFTTSGVIISNNIIKGRCCVAGAIQGSGLTIQNNLFFDGTNGGTFHDIDNSVVQNNIFLRSHPGLNSNQMGNSFLNNISYLTANDVFTLGVDGNTGSGNMEGVDPMLTNVPETSGDWNFSYDITPLAGSPVLNAGTDGTDIGPTGGANPFDPEGTFLPFIEQLTIPAIVTTGDDLDVNIKAKGN